MTQYADFRQRLDVVLRTLDSGQVRDFLIAEGQWDEHVPSDIEFAMWMMIAGSASLRDLHERALRWLERHGHEAEAQMMRAREKKPGSTRQGNKHNGPRNREKEGYKSRPPRTQPKG